ncbi:MAG: hypothetical protein AVO38_00320 [delta proteobacterium ML8_D]|jgi:hydroxymethylpyrimidine pyrophosphatase-like HAD family hydrolase|nr:MAG: hypothetical protein AVO38_00320 [delta proteobacterium ML8_D]
MVDYKFFRDYKNEIKENLKDLRVIYTDLDGTLLNGSGCLIKDYKNDYYLDALGSLARLEHKGLDVVLASGRNGFQLRLNAQVMGLKNYIAELGAELIYNLGEKVYTTFDDSGAVYDTGDGGRDLIKIIDLLKKSFPGKIESRIEWSRYRNYNAVFFGEIDLDKANSLLARNGYGGLVLVNNGFSSSLVKVDLNVEKLNIYILIPAGVDKSGGIKLDKKIRKFGADNCIALGDSTEDLKMAGEVKYCFLMRNALDGKEDISGELNKYDNVYIADGIMNRGWAEVIGFLLD